MTFSVVVCAYTEARWDALVAALRSVRDQSYPALETIVVVDHNTSLLERARSGLSGVTVVENSESRGLGGARNSGLGAAGGEIVAYLDDDALASSGWLAQLAAAYADPLVAGAGGAIEPIWEGERPSWFPDEFAWVVGCTYRGLPESDAPVRNLIGCNMSYRRKLLAALGGFRLGYGCDETELCLRLANRWPERVLLYVPAASVRHRVPAGRGRWRHFRSRCYFEGRSKAVVTWLAGASEGLASERAYTLRTLPQGVLRGLADAVLRRDPSGAGRAAAIAAGLAVTTAGYVSGRLGVERAARERGWEPTLEPSQ